MGKGWRLGLKMRIYYKFDHFSLQHGRLALTLRKNILEFH